MGVKELMQLLPEMCNKDRSSVRDDGLWNTVIADNVCNIQLFILSDSISGANEYEVG
jgi:hypothetical protein